MDTRLKDKEWRVNHLYQIRNKEGKLITFKRNNTQEHFNKNLHTRNLILKSRQLGFTTEEAIGALDEVLFTPNIDVLLIAHNLEAGESIFSKKINFAWEKLHPTLKDLYEVDNKTSKTLKFNFGNKGFSSIAVDTSGRSGTYQRVHITEFADLCKKYPKKVVDIIEGTIPAVPTTGRIDVESTSQGASGEFYEMFMDAWERGEPTSPLQYKAHFYNWTWDAEELSKIKPIPFKEMDQREKFEEYARKHQLIDIQITYYYQKWLSLNKKWNSLKREYPTTPAEAFEAVAEGTFYGETLAIMEETGRITVVPHDRALKVHTAWDLGVGKNMTVGFFQRDTATSQLRMIDYLEGEGSEALPEMIAKVLNKKAYIYGKHFGPHDLDATDISTGQTRKDYASKLGLKFTAVEDISLEDGINTAGLVLDRLVVDKEKCKKWIKSMKAYEREWDDKKGMYRDQPNHNWASHGADMWRYAAIAEKKMTNETQNLNRPFYDAMTQVWDNDIIEKYNG